MEDDYPVLVVDDDPVTRKLLEKYLVKSNFTVELAGNGKDALEKYRYRFFPIVITDWMMPEINGPELCRRIRQQNRDKYVFIIMVTARNSKEDIVSGLESGADDYLTKPVHQAELLARIKTGIRIIQLERSLRQANAEIRMLSITDPLTGCYNRLYLNERLPQEVRRIRRYRRPLALLMADIDFFKKVNDSYGHQAGDEVLRSFGGLLRNSIREGVDWIVRYSGEEFLIILPETDCAGAYMVAERLRNGLQQQVITYSGQAIRVTASFGGACVLPEVSPARADAHQLIEFADYLLYKAKEKGRNCSLVEVYSPEAAAAICPCQTEPNVTNIKPLHVSKATGTSVPS